MKIFNEIGVKDILYRDRPLQIEDPSSLKQDYYTSIILLFFSKLIVKLGEGD